MVSRWVSPSSSGVAEHSLALDGSVADGVAAEEAAERVSRFRWLLHLEKGGGATERERFGVGQQAFQLRHALVVDAGALAAILHSTGADPVLATEVFNPGVLAERGAAGFATACANQGASWFST
jgi:hypothetical protein